MVTYRVLCGRAWCIGRSITGVNVTDSLAGVLFKKAPSNRLASGPVDFPDNLLSPNCRTFEQLFEFLNIVTLQPKDSISEFERSDSEFGDWRRRILDFVFTPFKNRTGRFGSLNPNPILG